MDVTIVGAGAIGGTISAYLSRADLPVRLVDRDLDLWWPKTPSGPADALTVAKLGLATSPWRKVCAHR